MDFSGQPRRYLHTDVTARAVRTYRSSDLPEGGGDRLHYSSKATGSRLKSKVQVKN